MTEATQILAKKFGSTRLKTEMLVAPLSVEDFVVQPVPFVSPPKWHLAHSTWFFEEFILKNIEGYKIYNPEFNYLFNSYYNNVGQRIARDKRGTLTRPSVEEIMVYRRHVSESLLAAINNKKLSENDLSVLELGINHEQQHQELLLTDIKYILGSQPFDPIYGNFEEYSDEGDAVWIKLNEGVYEIGYEGSEFHFDNETNRHKSYLNDFEIRTSLVTNEEYLEFIKSGGYQDFNLWHDEGWTWLDENKITRPLYWKDNLREYYTLEGKKDIHLKAPVTHVNFFEASAYATWCGCRLPTEQEWETACEQFEWGRRWEWTASAYQPYPGYKKIEGAIGEYNGKFMVNQQVLRGGSIATAPGHSRTTYRNFFHSQYRWQYTGIRLAR